MFKNKIDWFKKKIEKLKLFYFFLFSFNCLRLGCVFNIFKVFISFRNFLLWVYK